MIKHLAPCGRVFYYMKIKMVRLNDDFIKNKIAHRGLHSESVSENSIIAFNLSIEKNMQLK